MTRRGSIARSKGVTGGDPIARMASSRSRRGASFGKFSSAWSSWIPDMRPNLNVIKPTAFPACARGSSPLPCVPMLVPARCWGEDSPPPMPPSKLGPSTSSQISYVEDPQFVQAQQPCSQDCPGRGSSSIRAPAPRRRDRRSRSPRSATSSSSSATTRRPSAAQVVLSRRLHEQNDRRPRGTSSSSGLARPAVDMASTSSILKASTARSRTLRPAAVAGASAAVEAAASIRSP